MRISGYAYVVLCHQNWPGKLFFRHLKLPLCSYCRRASGNYCRCTNFHYGWIWILFVFALFGKKSSVTIFCWLETRKHGMHFMPIREMIQLGTCLEMQIFANCTKFNVHWFCDGRQRKKIIKFPWKWHSNSNIIIDFALNWQWWKLWMIVKLVWCS